MPIYIAKPNTRLWLPITGILIVLGTVLRDYLRGSLSFTALGNDVFVLVVSVCFLEIAYGLYDEFSNDDGPTVNSLILIGSLILPIILGFLCGAFVAIIYGWNSGLKSGSAVIVASMIVAKIFTWIFPKLWS